MARAVSGLLFCADTKSREEIMKKSAAAVLCTAAALANPLAGHAQDVLTTHRLSAALAAGP
jgi:hypothetical protein